VNLCLTILTYLFLSALLHAKAEREGSTQRKNPMLNFTDSQLERYSRHIILQEVGVEGQEKILQAKVLIVGAGGLGSPAALYLAAAGIGTIGIADYDEEQAV